jgi:hypothetical protein
MAVIDLMTPVIDLMTVHRITAGQPILLSSI